MTSPQFKQDLELALTSYQIVGKSVQMYHDPEVWSPYSACEMLTFLTEYGYLETLEDCKVLDIGTGSGIIGIFCGLLGAGEITLSDYCPASVNLALKNAQWNGLKACGIQSNCFEGLKGLKFDLIISNPPVQPWLFTDTEHPENRTNSATWNEAGNDGRLVLDALITQSALHLTSKGILIISSSSRHGHKRTETLFNQYWENQWKQIYASEHQIDPHYHAPYLSIWKAQQAQDLDLRVYQKDAEGNMFSMQEDEKGNTFIIGELAFTRSKIPVKLIKEGDKWLVINKFNQKLLELEEGDRLLPRKPIDEHWYYKYYLMMAEVG
jgi:tRNA1(Val) A37 N6-methylase TrmN6